MLKQITEVIWLHESKFMQSNAVIVQGTSGVLLIDPGITSEEMSELAAGLSDLGQTVVAGFSTHPHWDHLLWHDEFGDVPRYATVRGTKEVKDFLSNPDWKTAVAPMLPPDIADQIPMNDIFGKVTSLPAGTTHLVWDGPRIRIIEHPGHAAGSAALLIEDQGVLVAGDMLSDILIPFLEFDAQDPIKDYLAALDLFEALAEVRVFIPGHGSVGDASEMQTRIKHDREYVMALHDGSVSSDPRLTTSPNGDVHQWQFDQIRAKKQ